MAERSRDHVHRLIHSMGKAEKRYFKLFIRRYEHLGKSNHEVLFDAISAMPEYDERALEQQFAGEAFMKRFPVTKRRLYEVILRGLGAFHAESSAEVRIRRMLHQVEVLHQRALYADAAKMLTSVRRQAEEHHSPTILLDVLDWERKLMERSNYKGVSSADLDQIRQRSVALRKEIQELEDLWHIKSEALLLLYHEGGMAGADIDPRLAALLEHPVMHHDGPGSPKANFLRNHILSAVAYAKGDMTACRDALEQNLEAIGRHATFFNDEPNLVLPVLSNLVHVNVRLGDHARAMALLARLRTIPAELRMPETEDLELKLFSTCTSLELDIHARSGDATKAMELVPLVERGLEKHADGLGPMRRAVLHYQLAYACMGSGAYREARRWCSKLLNDSGVDEFTEIILAGRYLDLILRAELDADKTLQAALRNSERYFAKHGGKRRLDKLFMDVIRRYARDKHGPNGQKALELFLSEVQGLEGDRAEHAVLNHLDPMAWAESKLTGKSFAEVVRERSGQLGRAA